MQKIRIISVPPGFAPQSIRAMWVGAVIPLATEEELAADPPSELGIGSSNTGGHIVLREKAILALKSDNKRFPAVAYWQAVPATYLVFSREVCEPVE